VCGAANLSEVRGDDAAKAPNWSAYTFVTNIVGEVVSADDKAVTVRVTGIVPAGGRPARGRPPQVKQQTHDYVLDYVPESLVRLKTLPPKKDEKDRTVPRTAAENAEARAPAGVTGYAASKSDITSGMTVEVQVVRDRKITAEKATEGDLRVKYVIIQNNIPTKTPDGPAPKGKKP
jgi:hypothetical protein